MSESQTLLKVFSRSILKGVWALLEMDDSENTWNKQLSVRCVSNWDIEVPTSKGMLKDEESCSLWLLR